ncbi:MAG: phage tail length tape measure family protein [Pseudomonadota bacterium]
MSDLVARLRLDVAGGDAGAAEVGKVEGSLEAVGPAAAAADRGARQAAAGMGVLGNAAQGTVHHLEAVWDAAQRDFFGIYNDGSRAFAAGSAAIQNSAKATASHLDTMYDATQRDFTAVWNAGANDYVANSNKVVTASGKVQAAAKLQGHEWLNLSRNFADVGVQAFMLQNPLMILIQQGPQIADVFQTARMRGVGFKDVMGEIAGVGGRLFLAGGVLAIGAGVVFALGKAFLDGERDAAAFNNALAVTGNFAGLTADSFADMAQRITTANNSAIGETKALLNQAVASGKLQGETLELAVQNAQKYAQLTGRSAESFLQSYEQMKGGVAKFGAEHAQQYHSLTLAQLKHIELLEKEGRTSEAQLQLMKDVAAGVGELQTNYGTLERALIGVRNAASDMWDKLLGIGRQKTLGTQLDEARAKLASMEAGGGPSGAAGSYAAQVSRNSELEKQATRQRIGVLEMLVKGQEKAAADRAAEAAKESDRITRYFSPSSKPRQAAAAPRDMSEERASQIEGVLAQARQEELNARLALTRDVVARAAIQKQILQAELVEKSAGIDRQIANIENDVAQKRLSAAKGQELVEQLLIVQAMQGRTAALQQQAADDETSAELARQSVARAQAGLTNQIDLLDAQAQGLRSAFARAVVDGRILALQQRLERSKQEEVLASAESTEAEKELARARLALLDQIHQVQRDQLATQVRLVDALGEATDAVRSFKSAWGNKDWAGLLDNLARTIETVRAAWAQQGPAGCLMTAGSAAATLIGGKTGRAIGNGLGIASTGAGLGSMLTAGALPAVGALTPMLGVGAAGALGGMMASVGAMLGPIGLAAGALYAAAKIFNLGGKPTNAGAGVNLISGEITGNKRTTETENAAKAAAEAILQGMKVLQGAGVTTKTSVDSLVLGTRDPTKIHLSDGQKIESAVGNAAAAVDAAMRAILQGATYQSETQKKLVESAIAAGKGFDEVAAILDSFAQAQSLVKGIDDAILQLSDPKAWAIEELKRSQAAFRESLKAASDAGNLTAEGYAAALAKLSTLEGLQLAETMKRFQDAVEASTSALSLTGSVNDRILELTNPTAFGLKRINDEIDAKIAEANPLIAAGELGAEFLGVLEELRRLEIASFLGSLATEVDETAKAFQDARPRLLSWLDELRVGAVSELSPKAQRAEAERQYQRQLALAQGGDKTALANITAYADRLLEADRGATSSASARLALRNQVAGQIEGLAGRGAETSPAAAIASLQAPLAQLAQASAAELATITSAGKAVVISNLPSMQAMYGDLMGAQTDRLIAANDRNAREQIEATKATADRLAGVLAELGARLDGTLAQMATDAAAQAELIGAGLNDLAYEQRLAESRQRMAS